MTEEAKPSEPAPVEMVSPPMPTTTSSGHPLINIEQNADLVNKLKSSKLQAILKELIETNNMQKLAELMQNDVHFADFVNEMLQCVGARDQFGQSTL